MISFLHNFIREVFEAQVRYLVIFCDSYAGQNKNHALFLYGHFVILQIKILKSIKTVFPIKGHSCMNVTT